MNRPDTTKTARTTNVTNVTGLTGPAAEAGRTGMDIAAILGVLVVCGISPSAIATARETVGMWTKHEIALKASRSYANPYTDVEVWVRLRGPGFDRRVRGFWDGGMTFRVRVVATAPGTWRWTSGASTDDPGLKARTGSFRAVEWAEAQKEANPNRRGFLRPTANGHAFQYADGTPFFLVGDTHWSLATWRYPWKGKAPAQRIVPAPGIGFEEVVQYRRRQGFNCIAFIACFPNWNDDGHPASVRDENGVALRHAWRKSGSRSAKDMHDEKGNRPFLFPGRGTNLTDVLPDFDRINPAYFRSLDRKIQYLCDHGMVAFFESVRRDHGPSWKRYYDWPGSFSRYVQYLIARYGCYNLIFSGVHLDWAGRDFSLDGPTWNAALKHHYRTYGGPPFGQPVTALADGSTLKCYGHGAQAPWLTMHGVGNRFRDHRIYRLLEEIFRLKRPLPALNQEAYYPGWRPSRVAGERTQRGSERECAFARAQMYGSVLSGGLAGHIYGTGAFGGNTTGEPRGANPYIWEALKYEAGAQMRHLRDFFLSEGPRYQHLVPSSEDVSPRKSPAGRDNNLYGWAFLARTPDRRLAMAYFESGCKKATLRGLLPRAAYRAQWLNPRTGEWLQPPTVRTAGPDGSLGLPRFPGGKDICATDWALKLTAAVEGERR